MIETDRLTLRRLEPDDAPFIFALVNEPSWLRFIGDRGVRTLDDARAYIVNGPMASYDAHGFGLYHVATKHDAVPIGICGLLKRDTLEDVDIGFALLPPYWSQGFALEAATGVLVHARALKLARIVAITSPDNHASIRVLEKLGMHFERMLDVSAQGRETSLYSMMT